MRAGVRPAGGRESKKTDLMPSGAASHCRGLDEQSLRDAQSASTTPQELPPGHGTHSKVEGSTLRGSGVGVGDGDANMLMPPPLPHPSKSSPCSSQ